MSTRNELIADLLMGAAYADNNLDGRELAIVKKLLGDIMGVSVLPAELTLRVESFDPEDFDAVEAVTALALTTEEEKRYLVELIAAVTDADEELDLDENAYLELVADALELPRESYADLTLEILSVETLQEAGRKLIQPPPLPRTN